MDRKSIYSIIFFLLFSIKIFSSNGMMETFIKTDKTVFSYGEPIYIDYNISNVDFQAVELKISSYAFLNYRIEITDSQNISVKERDEAFSYQYKTREELKEKSNPLRDKMFQTRVLSPREMTGIRLDLLDTYELKPGIYYLKGVFYPSSSVLQPEIQIETPVIRIIIKESHYQEEERKLEKEKLKIELRNIQTPEDTVQAFLEGKLEKNWEKFFYVLDTRKLMKLFPQFYQSFEDALDEERRNIEKDFKIFFQNLNTDEKILTYEIEETIIRKKYAIVKAVISSSFHQKVIKREYKFGLEKKDRWYIYAYSVNQK